MTDIKSMKLYSNVDRIYKELHNLGYDSGDKLRVEDLYHLDQLHYLGTEALDHAIEVLNLRCMSEAPRILDIGSGIGGPARYLVHEVGRGCQVTAVELQPDLHEMAQELTDRCGLGDAVEHVTGDILNVHIDDGSYDVVIALLTLLHIHDKRALFDKIYKALKPCETSKLYAEVLYRKPDGIPLTDDDVDTIQREFYCHHLLSLQEYMDHLHQAGFKNINIEPCDAEWLSFVRDRLTTYRANSARHISLLGPVVYSEQEHFYTVVHRMFDEGKISGGRITVSRI